jgi:4-hydroxythreonine-4-phosphate dehydrogenase
LSAKTGLNRDNIAIIEKPEDASSVFHRRLPVMALPNDLSKASATMKSIEHGVALCLDGQTQALVTAPISKKPLYDAGFTHPGHTEFLGYLTENTPIDGTRGPVMMLSGGGLRVALVTVHLSLRDIPAAITEDRIIQTASVLNDALKRDFGIKMPRIVMTGLNPHAGEAGSLGMEEIDILNPAAHKLRELGVNITDAQAADVLFHADPRSRYDAVLAMYHDQGLIPVKTLDFHGGVNITLGLPIIRTSPDHGTAYNIAGQGIARADSMIAAIRTARQLADNRARFDHG